MSKSDPQPNPFQHGPSRRTLLRMTGLTALAGGGVSALAACSSDAEVAAPPSSSSPATSAPASPSSAAPTSPSASPSASGTPSSSAPVPTGPSVATADVPVGGGVILEDAKVVVTQPTKGNFKAFSAVCTHRGCTVSKIDGDAIVCECHGSEFSIKDGSVLQPPASQPLAEASSSVQGDKVVVQA